MLAHPIVYQQTLIRAAGKGRGQDKVARWTDREKFGDPLNDRQKNNVL